MDSTACADETQNEANRPIEQIEPNEPTEPHGASLTSQEQSDQSDQTSQPGQPGVDQCAEWSHVMWAEYTTPSGFCCHSYIPRQPADQETIQIVVDLWQQNERLTTNEFWEAFNCQACSDWSKMQPDGTSFGGAWLTDKSNAWDLTRLQNFACLAELQFPRRTILYAIDFLCPRRCESVIQVKEWLEWIRQHVKATEQIDLALVQHDMQELDEFAKMHNVSVAHNF